MSAHAAEGLPQQRGLLVEPRAVRRRQGREQPAIELVAVAGDPRKEFGQRERRCQRPRAVPAEPRRHEDDTGEHGRGLLAEFRDPLGRQAAGLAGRSLGPGEDAVERDLLHDHAPETSGVVDHRRIPEAEEIVRAAGCRMEKVEGPRIEREFGEQRGVEVGLADERLGGPLQDFDRGRDELAIPAVRGPGTSDEERHGPHPLMPIGLGEPAVFEHRDRSPADVVVEPIDRPGHDRVVRPGLLAPARREHRLRRGHHEERPLNPSRWLVLEQVGVKFTVGRQQPTEHEFEHPPRLAGVAKRCGAGLEFVEPRREQRRHAVRGVRPLDHLLRHILPGPLDGRKEAAQRPPGGGVEAPRREIEIPEDEGGGVGLSGASG